MIAKITIVLFVLVCLMVGSLLVLLPWINLGGAGDWSDNYFVINLINLTGFESIKTIITSGWFRGAITGLGVFNLLIAFWEIANFSQSVAVLEGGETKTK